jgi:arylsulfatase
METIDDETTAAAIDFMEREVKADKPFFVWMNMTRMHIFTHVRLEYRGKSDMPGNEYADGMWEHDQDVGKLLKELDDLKIADNTIVVYTTDNGPNAFTWPDAATTPFRSEKDSNWEGAFRVPGMVRWPGHIKPGQCRTRSSPASTGSRRCWRRREARQSKGISSKARRSAARPSRFISTATTSCPT